MKKRKTKKQKERTQAKRKTQRSVVRSDDKIHKSRTISKELEVFALDKKLISQDLVKTVWVTVLILLLLLLLGFLQKGII
ncbi:MAG: hypothetical protein ABFQ62_04130 [Patescibacteria group bacterium]